MIIGFRSFDGDSSEFGACVCDLNGSDVTEDFRILVDFGFLDGFGVLADVGVFNDFGVFNNCIPGLVSLSVAIFSAKSCIITSEISPVFIAARSYESTYSSLKIKYFGLR